MVHRILLRSERLCAKSRGFDCARFPPREICPIVPPAKCTSLHLRYNDLKRDLDRKEHYSRLHHPHPPTQHAPSFLRPTGCNHFWSACKFSPSRGDLDDLSGKFPPSPSQSGRTRDRVDLSDTRLAPEKITPTLAERKKKEVQIFAPVSRIYTCVKTRKSARYDGGL